MMIIIIIIIAVVDDVLVMIIALCYALCYIITISMMRIITTLICYNIVLILFLSI